ncbi:hypothetical protein [Aeromicrobium sp. Leaf350]|uniref:hypothetical protein n=1 Tax=Aeromicrobium sp. Leaf350 TaxID=2876565 RepID=UPI001E535E28|nr:hypothetical protein [Aeromicrobium sp. Leaf350]
MTEVTPTPFCSYAEFGEAFFRAAVTEDRILAAIGQVAGRPMELGPIGVGPGRVAQVTAHGDVGEPVVRSVANDEVVYAVMLPVHLDFELDLQVDKHHFHGDLVVPITVHARATDDLRIVIDVTPPSARDIRMDLKADGLRASVVRKAAGVDAEVKKFVARYVAREISSPDVAGVLEVDVRSGIDATWEQMGR